MLKKLRVTESKANHSERIFYTNKLNSRVLFSSHKIKPSLRKRNEWLFAQGGQFIKPNNRKEDLLYFLLNENLI